MSKTPVPTATPDQCRSQLEDLQARHAKLEARREEIARLRPGLAEKSLLDGSARAGRKLQELSQEDVSITVELANVSAARDAATARLKVAEAKVAHEREIEKAQQARVLLAQRLQLAQTAQDALLAFNNAMEQLILAGRALRRLTDKATSDRHDGLALRSCQQMSRCDLHRRGFLSSEPLPPEELRVAMPKVIEHLDTMAKRWCDSLIDGRSRTEE